MKWDLRNKTTKKKAEKGDFQVVRSPLYAHYPIYFIQPQCSPYHSFSYNHVMNQSINGSQYEKTNIMHK